jgi:hypothetical protein
MSQSPNNDGGRIIGPSQKFQRLVDKLISILRSASKPEPITKETTIGDKAAVILADVNSAFFDAGNGFSSIASDLTIANLADQIIEKGGDA